MRLAIAAIALCTLITPAEAREIIRFNTPFFDTEEAGSWLDESAAERNAIDRRDNKASDLCRQAGGSFVYPREYLSPGDLDCRTRITSSGATEAKCHYVNAKAWCVRYE